MQTENSHWIGGVFSTHGYCERARARVHVCVSMHYAAWWMLQLNHGHGIKACEANYVECTCYGDIKRTRKTINFACAWVNE